MGYNAIHAGCFLGWMGVTRRTRTLTVRVTTAASQSVLAIAEVDLTGHEQDRSNKLVCLWSVNVMSFPNLTYKPSLPGFTYDLGVVLFFFTFFFVSSTEWAKK